jgi:YgiT-type zinc finger domain-containing protein
MAALKELQHGRCPCGGHYESHEVEVTMTVRGDRLVLPGVPQGRCTDCSSRVYKLLVLQYIESAMRGAQGDSPQWSR